MKNLKNFELETDRLTLIPVTMDYAPEIFKEFTPEITKYMVPPSPKHISETEEFIQKSIEELLIRKNLNVVVLDRRTKEFLGGSGLGNIDTDHPEPGIWIKKSAHGLGYGYEAVKALVDWAKISLDYEYIFYPVDCRNKSSCKIAEKLGGKIFNKRDYVNVAGFLLHLLDYKIE